MKKSFYQTIFFVTLSMFILQSCEEPYTPETIEADQQLVVEGFVEAGTDAQPTFVLVTKSIPFLDTLKSDQFSRLFVTNAIVTVNDGAKSVQLIPLCLKDLPPDIRRQAAAVLGLNPDSLVLNICAYIDVLNQIDKRVGGKYDLKVIVGNIELTSTTTIPENVPLTKFRWSEPPGEPSDTLARLWVTIKDPAGKNYYRYFTQQGNENLIAPVTSVTDDLFFEAKEFEFPLQRAQRRGSFDPNSFGLYMRGDSVTIKWCTIDEAHFGFWNTRDFAANSGGPFASYTRIKTNITGGLGIWGGYYANTYRLYCPKK
jgi:hypothetical protein